MMNCIDEQYQELLREILNNGVKKEDRTGTGTLSIFGYQIRHNLQDGFPLLTTKKMAVKSMITELKWFLKGDTNIKYLVENGCNIWNGDAYKRYVNEYYKGNAPGEVLLVDRIGGKEERSRALTMDKFIVSIKHDDEFAKKWGELGPIYGNQWRNWSWFDYQEGNYSVDQIKNVIELLKTNPDSRRIMVNAWNVGELDNMVLPPCHYGFQLYTRELSFDERCDIAISQGWFTEMGRFDVPETHWMLDHNNIPKRAISLLWNQRSVDTFLGLPFNIASYALLLLLFAEEVNMVPEELIGNLGDTHLYLNHIEQAKEQLNRTPNDLPTIKLSNVDILNGEFDYELIGYESHPAIKAPLSN